MPGTADKGGVGRDDAIRMAQGDQRIHSDIPARKAIHQINVHHGQLASLLDALHHSFHIDQRAGKQKNGAAWRGQSGSEGRFGLYGSDHRLTEQSFDMKMHRRGSFFCPASGCGKGPHNAVRPLSGNRGIMPGNRWRCLPRSS